MISATLALFVFANALIAILGVMLCWSVWPAVWRGWTTGVHDQGYDWAVGFLHREMPLAVIHVFFMWQWATGVMGAALDPPLLIAMCRLWMCYGYRHHWRSLFTSGRARWMYDALCPMGAAAIAGAVLS